MIHQELYHPEAVAANSTTIVQGQGLGGFIAVTAGTITVTNRAGVIVLNAFPVSAGAVYGLALFLGINSYTVTLAGGASGTLLKA